VKLLYLPNSDILQIVTGNTTVVHFWNGNRLSTREKFEREVEQPYKKVLRLQIHPWINYFFYFDLL